MAMKVIYYRSPSGNFGDDLNAVLWKEVLSPACFAVDDAVLLGIGSIFRDDFLSEEATEDKRVFVLGSGAGTGPLPSRWPNENWSILAVRGPLTAALIDLPQAAVTDAAALMAIAPKFQRRSSERHEIVFMPHYNSVQYSRWPDICRKLDLTYIDPHWPVEQVLACLGRSQLVVTEAMHGAIVADTLRIPWVPVLCSPEITPFKWVDWTQSLELDYRPHALPASSAWEALKNYKNRKIHDAKGLEALSDNDQDIIDDFFRRCGNVSTDELVRKPLVSRRAASRMQRVTSLFDGIFSERAADALAVAIKGPSYLSKDSILMDRVERLQYAVAKLERTLLGPPH